MQLRTLFGLTSLSAAVVLALVLVFSAGAGGQSATQPALTGVAQAQQPDVNRSAAAQSYTTAYLPVVYGPPAFEEKIVVAHDAAQFYSGGETWEAAKAGADLYLLGPNYDRVKARVRAPGGSLAIYAFARTIVYFDTSHIADRHIAGDLTLTYWHDSTWRPRDLSYGLVFRRASASPATKEMWGDFEGWPLLASPPVTTTLAVTRTVTLDTSAVRQDDGTLPETLAVGIQTSEPRLGYEQSISSNFKLSRMKMSIPLNLKRKDPS